MEEPKKNHYISNSELFKVLEAYHRAVVLSKKQRTTAPPLPDPLGEAFLKIADRLARKPNFASYTFREDMIADAVENCCQYAGNFDPAKSHNPFSYFTQIIYFAFLRRISREKKHLYVKYKAMELQGRTNPTVQEIEEGAAQGAKLNLYDNIQEFIHNFETTYDQKKLKESKKSTPRSTRKAKSSSIKNYLTPLF
jgi:hypothetical protein